ncbi:hypothetical protein Tco_1106021 [Tanacetum coccineum]
MVSRVSCDGDGVVGVPGVVGVVGIQKKGDPTGSTMMVMMGIIPETTSVCLFVESRVSNPETTFVGVESGVSNPETTFVGVESKSELSRFRRSDCGGVLENKYGPSPACGLGPLGFDILYSIYFVDQ